MDEDLEKRIEAAVKNPQNLGEMENADAIGTVGSADCGDMLRMWVKFKEEGGRKVIDRATFQTFGCQTAIAVASLATEMLAGKTVDEAMSLSGADLAAPSDRRFENNLRLGAFYELSGRGPTGWDAGGVIAISPGSRESATEHPGYPSPQRTLHPSRR